MILAIIIKVKPRTPERANVIEDINTIVARLSFFVLMLFLIFTNALDRRMHARVHGNKIINEMENRLNISERLM